MLNVLAIAVSSLLMLNHVKCANVLLVSNCISHSHSMWFNKMASLLVNSGHQVVLLDTDPLKIKTENVTHFLIEGAYEMDVNWTPEVMEDMFEYTSQSAIRTLDFYLSFSVICRKFIKSNGVKNLMKTYEKKKIDLIILDYYCDSFLGLVPFFGNPPFIIATAFADPENVLEKVGLYDNPSYVPTRMFSSFSVEMDLVERATNLFYNLYLFYKLKTQYMPFEEESSKEIFGESSPSLADVGRNVSLVMVNTHYVTSGAKPLPPAVIPIFGFHIDPIKPLPQDINKFLNDAKEGVILFSFGTNIPHDMITPTKLKIFIEVFSSIPQRVVWKFNASLVDKIPSNVMIKDWIPQSDILAHENVAAFISHGGLLGTQEAMYFGVPIIGVPFFIDQISNVDRIVKKGLGMKLSFKYLTNESLRQTISEVTENRSYKEKMRRLSKVLHDEPMKPKEVVKYWIEYVLRNKDDLNYIRSQAVQLPVYQLLLLDVLASCLIITFGFLITSWVLIKFLCNVLACRRKSKQKIKIN